jgi:hypothetical protein
MIFLIVLVVWFFLGWVGAKACLRHSKAEWPELYGEDGDVALAVAVFIFGPFGYLAAWACAFKQMARLHGLRILFDHRPHLPVKILKFFGE